MIVRAFVVAHGFPIDCFRRRRAVGIFLQNFIVEFFPVCPFLLQERYARQGQQKLRGKFILREIALDAVPFFTVLIQYQDGWCPD